MWALRIAAFAGAGAAAMLGAAPAHADDAGYLAALDAQGVFRSGTPDARLSAGHKFCAELRGGASPDQIAAHYRSLPTFGAPSMIDDLRGSLGPVIAIAQHELCPDTLGR
jgi:hypothetical protein